MSIEEFEAVIQGDEFVTLVMEKRKAHGVHPVVCRYSTWFGDIEKAGFLSEFEASFSSSSFNDEYVEITDIPLFGKIVKAMDTGYYIFVSDQNCLVVCHIQRQTFNNTVGKGYVDRQI